MRGPALRSGVIHQIGTAYDGKAGPQLDISIIVVTWNAKKFVEECFGSIKEETRNLSTETVVLDNASTDGTADVIAERFPEVKLIRSTTNLGFPGGNVVAIQASRPAKYVCLVNPDVRVLSGCFRKLMDYMEKHSEVGVVGPRTLNPDGTIQRSCMRSPSVWTAWCRALALDRTVLRRVPLFGGIMMADFAHDRTRRVDVLNGAFLLIRRTAMEQVGLIDDRYFMYGDDIDWCLRFRKAGWSVVFDAEAEAIHYGGGTTARAPVYFYVEMQKANLQYWQKHHSRGAQTAFLASVWVHEASRYLIYSVLSKIGESWRTRVAFKAERSLASMRWLLDANQLPNEPATARKQVA
jgi:GT2 family glycosyltransferase